MQAARKAPFNPKTLALHEWIVEDPGYRCLRGQNYFPTGRVIDDGTLLPSDYMHCQKRIMDGQWKPQTTVRGYKDDLQRALSRHHAYLTVKVAQQKQDPSPPRVGYFLKLGDQGSPLASVAECKGMSIFIAYDPEAHCLLTGYLIDERRVDSYPGNWINKKEINL